MPFNLKLFLLTVLLGMTVEMYIGTTYAVFTASTQVSGNVFSTGNWTVQAGSAKASSLSFSAPVVPPATPTPALSATPTVTPDVTSTPIPTVTVTPEITITISPTPGP